MSKDIQIKKGLNINLLGMATKSISAAINSNYYSIRPEDFHGLIPKLNVKVGDKISAGDTVFFDKSNDSIKITSPVSGGVIEISRGEKRRILEIKIKADKKIKFKSYEKLDFNNANAEKIKAHLLDSGCWPFIKQRPYDIIASPDIRPKAIFISAHASAPLLSLIHI